VHVKKNKPRTIAFYILLQRLAGSGRWPCSSETDSKRPNMHAHLSIPRLVCLGNIFPWHAHTVCVNISLHLFTRRKFEAVNDGVMGFQWISFLPRDCLRFWVRTVFKNCLAIVVSIQPHVFKDFGSMEARIWKILELYIYIYKSPVFLNIAKTYNHKLCRVSMICLVFIPVHMPITLKHWNLILSFFPLSFCDELTPSHLPVFVPVSYTPDMWTS
jgi:hypothetical protein